MQKLLAHCGMPLLVLLLSVFIVYGSNYFTLEPVDTNSPRATIMSFLRYSDAYVTAIRTGQPRSHNRNAILQRAIRCFELSGVAPILLEDVGRESVLLLHEILGRIALPAMDDIPDREEVKKLDLDRWNIPLTGINIKSVTEGSQVNTFLFSSETIENLYRYYREVEHLPYNSVLQQGLYEHYLYAAGWMIPQVLLDRMPSWLKRGYHGQTVWQWAGLILLSCIGCLLLWSLFISYRNSKSSKTDSPYSWTLLIY